VRGEEAKGVGSVPMIRCKVSKEAGCEIRCIGEAVHVDLR